MVCTGVGDQFHWNARPWPGTARATKSFQGMRPWRDSTRLTRNSWQWRALLWEARRFSMRRTAISGASERYLEMPVLGWSFYVSRRYPSSTMRSTLANSRVASFANRVKLSGSRWVAAAGDGGSPETLSLGNREPLDAGRFARRRRVPPLPSATTTMICPPLRERRELGKSRPRSVRKGTCDDPRS